jgi:hypothetical protein
MNCLCFDIPAKLSEVVTAKQVNNLVKYTTNSLYSDYKAPQNWYPY